jgi:hypothetical protein
MVHVTPGRLAVVLTSVLVLAGCTTAQNDRPSQTNTTTTTTTEPTTSASVQAACDDVTAKAQVLLTVVGQLATGKATTDQVRAAADELADSFTAAKSVVGPETQADLDDAGAALTKLLDALSAQPIDTATAQTAANEVFTALGNAAAVCYGTSSTLPTTATPTDTESVTSTS